MIFGTPISWFLNEIIASILLLICIAHIVKQENSTIKLFELFAYMITAGIFENIGVFSNAYYYSHQRLMMFGNVPFSILFIEGAILYTTFQLFSLLKAPKWIIPFGAGLLASIQDMTLDPSSIYDLNLVNGVLEGQWNWTKFYDGGYVDIPFYNFSGWFTMIFFFSVCMLTGRFLYEKYKKRWIGITYPFASIIVTVTLLISPINQFLLYTVPFAEINTKTNELIMLLLLYTISALLIFRFVKYDSYIVKKDRIVFAIPIFLHIYAIITCITLGITYAILPVVIVAALHSAYLIFVYLKTKNAER
ncbi:carotenoid biosynthesis protein [Eubacteriaceae bacterium ES3]|nr:carotenoid biosynthesis protein [Eubacteriaceae bacterium ES3]